MATTLRYQANANFPHRYISPESLYDFLQRNLSDYILEIGQSSEGRPVYKVRWGHGPVKVLAWTQMHGNESTATHAVLDLFESLDAQPLLAKALAEKVMLETILMLNPDGSKKWTRRTALDLDLNRDFLKQASCEFKILRDTVAHGNYDFGLNLHEQRTIFSTDGRHPATLSFLAPSENYERDITENRQKSMAIIAATVEKLQEVMPNHIARYTDEFYPTSTGDNFMKAGFPTVLFEGGHYENDYLRKETRRFYTTALYHCLDAIGTLQGATKNWEDYFEIPENREDHYDVIYRNVKLNTSFPCVLDVAIQYREFLPEGAKEIDFLPVVAEVGDCGQKKGWKEYDCTGKYFKSDSKYPKLDAIQNFEITDKPNS